MAKAKKEKTKTKKKSLGFLFFFLFTILALTFIPTALLLLAGFMPTISMAIAERNRTRYLSFCIGIFNLLGITPFVFILWTTNHSLETVGELLVKPFTWLVMYGTSCIGLMIYTITPPIVKIVRNLQLNQKLEFAENEKKKILEEWGDKIEK